MVVSIGQASVLIGVAISTLRRWEKEERFAPSFRTKGMHRRYRLSDIQEQFFLEKTTPRSRVSIGYSRVSSHDQKADLERQTARLKEYCETHSLHYELISDLGSGLNFHKKGLNQLIGKICLGLVDKLILTHKDRLLRFGSPLLFKLCNFYGTSVVILENSQEKSFEAELVADVIEIMTVYTAKLHGKRSHSNLRKKVA